MKRRLSHPATGPRSPALRDDLSHRSSPVAGRCARALGLLIDDLTNPFYPELVHAFEDLATQHGYQVLLGSTGYDTERTRRCIQCFRERHVEGAAILTFGSEGILRGEMVRQLGSVPLVFIDEAPPAPRTCALTIDYRHGMAEAVRHLTALGHRRIGFISGPLGQHSAQLRKAGFLASVRDAGCVCRESWQIEGNHTLESGMHAMERILARKSLPTAVLCSNDLMALGAIRVLNRNGTGLPAGLSLVGFDDIQFAEFATPPLTTIRMSRKALARAAVEALRSLIELPDHPVPGILLEIPTSLIVRQSTGYAPRAAARRKPAVEEIAAPDRRRA